MTVEKIQLGRTGEEAAVAFLEQKGYRIVERNFTNALGEIDMIAIDGDTLVFIEVKTRNSDSLGSPLEAVTSSKQKQIIRVALSYLQEKRKSNEQCRFDVVSVLCAEPQNYYIEVIENAFECC